MAKIELHLATARDLAERIVGELRPGCRRIEIAGSVRRGKALVGDLEIVAIPEYSADLLGEVGESALEPLLAELLAAGRLIRGRVSGPRFKNFGIPAVPGLGLDLFLVRPETWGVHFAIRTGDASFSKALVTPREAGGLMPNGWKVEYGRVWRAEAAERPLGEGEPCRALETPEERDLFGAYRLPWVEPADRTAATVAKLRETGP